MMKSVIARIVSFLESNAVLIIAYALLMILPDIRRNPQRYDLWLLHSLPFSILLSVGLCAVGQGLKALGGSKLGRTLHIVWHTVCHVVLYVLAFVDLYLLMAFGLGVNQESLLLVLQTNTKETGEFLSGCISDGQFWLCMLLFVVAAAVEYVLLKREWLKGRVVVIAVILLSIMGVRPCFNAFAMLSESGFSVYQTASDAHLDETSVVKLYCAVEIVSETVAVGERIDEHIADTRVNKPTDYKGQIVLVIGESHNKWHSAMYGYKKDTNPNLRKIKDNLAVFRNVITPKNVTYIAFQQMFSVSSLDDSLAWNETTLFPAVFKSAGWNVALCSNQFTDEQSSDNWGAEIVAFMNTKKTNAACFTTRNHRLFRYDGEMIDSFLVHGTKGIDANKPTLTILNLVGQHRVYRERFPESKAVFKASDYADRNELTDRQRQFVADYDNACLYNDEQLYRICQAYKDEDAVVIYLSDHGDEVYDYRAKRGRAYDLREHAPYSYRYQLEVPFFIYMTDAYRQNHPQKAEEIRNSVKRKFMTDDLCHLLFYLGEIDTKWFNPSRCLVHNSYNEKRKRVLLDGDDYDEMVK